MGLVPGRMSNILFGYLQMTVKVHLNHTIATYQIQMYTLLVKLNEVL